MRRLWHTSTKVAESIDISKLLPEMTWKKKTKTHRQDRQFQEVDADQVQGLTERSRSEKSLLLRTFKDFRSGQNALIDGVIHDPLLHDHANVFIRPLTLLVVLLQQIGSAY